MVPELARVAQLIWRSISEIDWVMRSAIASARWVCCAPTVVVVSRYVMYISSAPLTASTNTTSPTKETTYFPNSPQVRGRALSRSANISSSCGARRSSTQAATARKSASKDGKLRASARCDQITDVCPSSVPTSTMAKPAREKRDQGHRQSSVERIRRPGGLMGAQIADDFSGRADRG